MRMWYQVIAVVLLVTASIQAGNFSYTWENSTGNPGEASQYDFYRMGDAGWNYAGAYTQNVLTSYSEGVVYNTTKRNTTLGFDLSASITIHPNQQGALPGGFAWILNGDSRGMDPLPTPGPGQTYTDLLGYEGLSNSLAIEFDMKNGHIFLVTTLDGAPISANHDLENQALLFCIGSDYGIEVMKNVYAGGIDDYTVNLRLAYSGAQDDLFSIYLNDTLLSVEGGLGRVPTTAYLGIGGGGNDLFNFPVSTLNSFDGTVYHNPEPASILLLAFGTVLLVRRQSR